MTDSDQSQFVEEAMQLLRNVPVPDGPPVELLGVTAARLQSLSNDLDVPQPLRSTLMFQVTRYGRVVVIGAAVVAVVAWIGMIDHSGTLAFADVKQQVDKLRSVRYVHTRLVEVAADDNEEMQRIERGEGKVEYGRTFKTASNAHQPRIVRVLGRYLQRSESLNAMGEIESISISDSRTGKHVELRPKEKQFLEFDTQVTLAFDSGKKTESQISPTPEVDLYASIREIPSNAITRLPARTIEGKQVIGFYSETTTPTKMGTQTWERTYWVDLKTKLPVRIEVCHHSTDKRMGRSEWIYSGFVFDEELPETLFSTEVPAGYLSETQKIYGIQLD